MLKEHFLDLYRRGLEERGIGVTQAGIAETPAHVTPNTRSLDKEVRLLRREVSVLAELQRSFFQIVVKLGACTAEQLRDYLLEQSMRQLYEGPGSSAPSASSAPAANGTEGDAIAANGEGSSNGVHPEDDGAVTSSLRRRAEDDSRPLAERLRRPLQRTPEPDPFQRLRVRPEKPVKPRPKGALPKPPIRMKQCSRCFRNIPIRAPRCLSCGYRF